MEQSDMEIVEAYTVKSMKEFSEKKLQAKTQSKA